MKPTNKLYYFRYDKDLAEYPCFFIVEKQHFDSTQELHEDSEDIPESDLPDGFAAEGESYYSYSDGDAAMGEAALLQTGRFIYNASL